MADIPNAALLKRLRDKKIQKYLWIPEVLSRMLIKFMPSNSEVEFDDLYSAGLLELTKQMDRLYTDPKLIKRLWNPKKKDLTVGPFFLKGVNSPYINQRDSASLKFVKGAILDEMRKHDPAPSHIRKDLKKINKFKNDYFNTLGRYPRRNVLKEKFNLTDKQLDKLLYYDEG
ncbi:structural protein [Yersinia phage YerA41]|nr:structural protein [Yersinia phage YerA41]